MPATPHTLSSLGFLLREIATLLSQHLENQSGDLCPALCPWVSPGERFNPKRQKQPQCPQASDL